MENTSVTGSGAEGIRLHEYFPYFTTSGWKSLSVLLSIWKNHSLRVTKTRVFRNLGTSGISKMSKDVIMLPQKILKDFALEILDQDRS